MRYKVLGRTVHTERTAKPRSQSSKYLRTWLLDLQEVRAALDFGCGRLRYSFELAKIARNLTLVDSEEQLSRTQMIDGFRTNVRELIERTMPNVRVLSIEEFEKDSRRYDFALCANVLPIIPSATIRGVALRRLSNRLKSCGRCLLVTQFRNSYFDAIHTFNGAARYLDGWAVIRDNGSSSYYGLIPKKKLVRLAERNGFVVNRSWIEGQSAYALCTPNRIIE